MKFRKQTIHYSLGILLLFTCLLRGLAQATDAPPTYLSKLSLTELDDNLSLELRLSSSARCTFGDRDAIALDMFRSTDTYRLILSLEPLAQGTANFQGQSVSLTKSIISLDEIPPLALPFFSAPTLLGLYICKDQGDSGTCSDKQVLDVNKIIRAHGSKSGVKSNAANDKVYFFQPIIAYQNSLWFPSKMHTGERTNNKLLSEVTNIFSPSNLEVPKEFTKALSIDNTLRSEALATASGAIKVELPHYSASKCRGKNL